MSLSSGRCLDRRSEAAVSGSSGITWSISRRSTQVRSIRYSLPQQEFVDSFLFPHALHDQTVQVDKQSAAKTTRDSTDRTEMSPVRSPQAETEKHPGRNQSQHLESRSPQNGEGRQLLKVEREVQTEAGLKESGDGLWRESRLVQPRSIIPR